MKRYTTIAALCTIVVLGSCNRGPQTPAPLPDSDMVVEAVPIVETLHEPVITADGDSRWTYNDHVYTMEGNISSEKYDRKATGTVTFTNVPADYREFQTLYTQFLGLTPYGTAAMMPMAMELYGRDHDLGEDCIRLICYPSDVNSILSILKQKFRPATDADADDSYVQRYLPAAVLQGATPDNGYQPDEPYTIEIVAGTNKHQELQFMGEGRIVYLNLLGQGWDNEQRAVEVVKQPGDSLHRVFNCPSLYTQCKRIQGQWGGLR